TREVSSPGPPMHKDRGAVPSFPAGCLPYDRIRRAADGRTREVRSTGPTMHKDRGAVPSFPADCLSYDRIRRAADSRTKAVRSTGPTMYRLGAPGRPGERSRSSARLRARILGPIGRMVDGTGEGSSTDECAGGRVIPQAG